MYNPIGGECVVRIDSLMSLFLNSGMLFRPLSVLLTDWVKGARPPSHTYGHQES